MSKESERQKWKRILESENIILPNPVKDDWPEVVEQFNNLLLDYARIADPTIHISDSEINQICEILDKNNIRVLMDERPPKKIRSKLSGIQQLLRSPKRLDKIEGIEKFMHMAHITSPNLISRSFDMGPTYQFEAQDVLDFLASPKVNKYFSKPVPSITQTYRKHNQKLFEGIKL